MHLVTDTVWCLGCSGVATPAEQIQAECMHALDDTTSIGALCAKGWPVAVEQQQQQQQRTFHLPAFDGATTPPVLTLRELSFEEAGYGHKVWGCGVALSIWLALHPERVEGRRILELGSGLGISGISASLVARGQCSLTLSDLDEEGIATTLQSKGSHPEPSTGILSTLEANAAANDVAAQTIALDWHQSLEPSFEPSDVYDLVIAADCIYASADAAALAATVRAHTAPGGTALLMNRVGRAGSQELLDELSGGS